MFAVSYSMESIGLSHFNVLAPRQDPNGAYVVAAPESVYINGDDQTSRDSPAITHAPARIPSQLFSG